MWFLPTIRLYMARETRPVESAVRASATLRANAVVGSPRSRWKRKIKSRISLISSVLVHLSLIIHGRTQIAW